MTAPAIHRLSSSGLHSPPTQRLKNDRKSRSCFSGHSLLIRYQAIRTYS
jgi:hypothetical protein